MEQDPLSRALETTTEERHEFQRLDEATPNQRHVGDMLERLREQALEAVELPFFDAAIGSEIQPIRTVGKVESGCVFVSARRHQPPYHAELTLDVRCDHELAQAHWVVEGRCSMKSDADAQRYHREFIIVTRLLGDGNLLMDVDQVRSEMAAAIQSMGKLPEG